MHCRQAKNQIPKIRGNVCILAMDKFNTYIEHIEPEFWRELCVSEGQLRHYERGEEFVRVGSVARYVGYIQSGTMKYVGYSEGGAEHVVGMHSDGEFIADFPWSLYGMEARVSIVVVKPCDIYCFPTNELKRLMDASPELQKKVMHATEAIHSTLYDRYLDLCCKTPQQRYDALLSTYPDIFAWFSLKDIASFLNVTPTHLSRLRKFSKIQG